MFFVGSWPYPESNTVFLSCVRSPPLFLHFRRIAKKNGKSLYGPEAQNFYRLPLGFPTAFGSRSGENDFAFRLYSALLLRESQPPFCTIIAHNVPNISSLW